METLFPGNGSDFNPHAPYRMYHGDKVPGFPQHPHRGFETITATNVGLIDHADSVGNAGRYGEGDVQWMTAGDGVVHGEMFPLVFASKPNHTKFFQLWLNLPAKSKKVEPCFAMFWSNDVPVYKSENGNVSIAVWAGDYFLEQGHDDEKQKQNSPPPDSWAADPENDVAVLHITIRPGGKLVLPKANKSNGSTINRTMYLIEGHTNGVEVDGKVLGQKVYLEMDATKDVVIEIPSIDTTSQQQSTEFLLLQGKPINEPVAQHGPFVMNTRAEIQEAFRDYQRTKFGGWPWPRDDMIFPRDKGRFALINGKETRPSSSSLDDVEKKEDEL